MKVLYLEWNSYGNTDMKLAFQKAAYELEIFPFYPASYKHDPVYEDSLRAKIKACLPDYLYSFNYFPLVAGICHDEGIPYVAWVYDSPSILLYSYTVIFPTNYIFCFDKELCHEFQSNGIDRIFYLPLAAGTDRLDQLKDFPSFYSSSFACQTPISFVGSLYTEKSKSNFFERFQSLPPYSTGYIDGLMAAQKHVAGYNFIQELLSRKVLADLQKAYPARSEPDSVESDRFVYAEYYINRRLTSIERTELLTAVSESYGLDLYSPSTLQEPHTINHGQIHPDEVAPYIYKASKINLNITLRSIKSGIPLRAFDIMGAGGFLISNFQADFLDFFTPGMDFVYYETKEELLQFISYYLAHEDERLAMAEHAHNQIKMHHTYDHRIMEIESILF